jgi:adenine deaminase
MAGRRAAESGDGSPKGRDSLVRVALGKEPPDTVVVAGRVFDAVSGQFVPERSLWVKDGRIARVAAADEPVASGVEVLDLSDSTLVPGLIDGHSHLIRIFIPEFVRALIPTGVTSVVLETMEYGPTHGIDGTRLLIGATRGQPVRVFHLAPALCGLTEAEEEAALTVEQLDELLSDPQCLGLGEVYWGNALHDGPSGERVRALVERTLAAGKVAEGHTAGAKGARLDAYTALGFSSCHEPISVEEALEVYRRGYLVMLREGGIRRDLEQLRPLFDMDLDFRRFALVTDSVDPERLETWGYLDEVVREALALGIDPAIVYRMTGANVAEHFHRGSDLGYLAPGRLADIVAIPAPDDFRPTVVMVGGRTIFERGTVLAEPGQVAIDPTFLRTLDFDVDRALAAAGPPPALPAVRPVRVIEYVSNLVTRETILSPAETVRADLLPLLALERTRGEAGFWGLAKGLGLTRGAYAATTSWDSPVLLAVGPDLVALRTAVARLVETGGGVVFAEGDHVVAESLAPICGVATLESAASVRADLRALIDALRDAGIAWEDPFLAVDTLTTPAIPHLRISHRGYVRLKDRALLPLWA